MTLIQLDNIDEDLKKKRGEGTRYALIMAGLELFGEYGLKATTTRMLAEKSGANVAAIPYYFGGKEGLYEAVIAYIADRIDAHIGDMGADISARIADGLLTQHEAKQALHNVMQIFTDLFVSGDEPKAWAQIIIKEQAKPTAAFDIFYDSNMKHMQLAATSLIAIIAELDPNGEEAKIRAHALFGQVLGFLVSRESFLRNMGLTMLSPAHALLIQNVLRAHIEACINIPKIDTEVS